MVDIIIKGGLYGERTMQEWQDHFNIRITNPEGWLLDGMPGDIPLTEASFMTRALLSEFTCLDGDMSFLTYARKLEENGGLYVR